MQIGIIGSGKVGRALGAWFAKTGFPPLFASRNQTHAMEAAQMAGYGAKIATTTTLVKGVARLSCWRFLLTKSATRLNRLANTSPGKRSLTPPIQSLPDHRALVIGHMHSGAEEIASKFPTAKVVKAFNAVFAEVYAGQKAQN